jgi:glycosyltransferase involved in cell wall biosynthesis
MDAVVLATHGEGWGLPLVEGMAMGLPVIATNWSGNTGNPRKDIN